MLIASNCRFRFKLATSTFDSSLGVAPPAFEEKPGTFSVVTVTPKVSMIVFEIYWHLSGILLLFGIHSLYVFQLLITLFVFYVVHVYASLS